MLPLMRWRYSVAEGPPGVRFTFLDYVALGFILEGAVAFLHEGTRGWLIWIPGFALGLATLAFRDRSPQFTAWLIAWFQARKKLAAALAENVEMKKQLTELRESPSKDPLVRKVFESIQESRRQCGEELQAALLQIDALKAEPKLTALLSPLQIEALSIAKDLRDFLVSLPPFPSDPTQTPGEENPEYLVRFHQVRTEEQGKWRAKLMHGYANRKFGERITALMHRAGEEVGYPAYVPNYAEKPPLTADDVSKLAQQMEMVAIWINRKERGEVNLLK